MSQIPRPQSEHNETTTTKKTKIKYIPTYNISIRIEIQKKINRPQHDTIQHRAHLHTHGGRPNDQNKKKLKNIRNTSKQKLDEEKQKQRGNIMADESSHTVVPIANAKISTKPRRRASV